MHVSQQSARLGRNVAFMTDAGHRRVESIRSHLPLTDAQIMGAAPSVFTEQRYEATTSERYSLIPTIEVLRGLRREGFEAYYAAQTRVRDADRREFTRHLLRLRRPGGPDGGVSKEVILANSHDGTSAYRLMGGCFRWICNNGLAFGDIRFDQKVGHSGKVVDKVIEGAFAVTASFEAIEEAQQLMQRVQLSSRQQAALAAGAIAARWGIGEPGPGQVVQAPVQPAAILAPRRYEDRGADVWRTFNRIQENLMRGGVQSRSTSGRNMHTRPITSVNADLALNRALWAMSQALAGQVEAGAVPA